ncbi:tyrosine-type recombinase/integrase [Chachezhania sediminis]|uniref:tyrosine-type recombinase/integrase n=1 Tax=Chachezhania sediminis TaxID=2599291 RepID=UPI00131D2A74|nr:integrase arm-type DNA-binding domain-containing protein [Chachezhania sediminis]
MKNKLTAVQIRNAGDGKLYDGGGLMLVKKAGLGKWVFRYSFLDRRRDMGLGSLADLTLADARKLRDQWAVVLAHGEDPIAVRDARQEDAKRALDRSDPTFADMVDTVFEARKATLRADGKRGRWRSPLDHYVIPAIGKKRMSRIDATDVKLALAQIWRTKHPTAVKAIRRTKIVFTQAQLMGVACDPFTVDAAQHMLGAVSHEEVHHPAVAWQDMPALYRKLSDEHVSHLCLRWAMLTLVRSDGCRGARLAEIDGGIWTVPKDRIKGREGKVTDFRVPLSQEALHIADICRRFSGDLLFPGPRGTPVSDQAMHKILRKQQVGGSIHGFRTSFRTWVQDTEACSYEVAETVLGHKIGGKVERAYARSDLLGLRAEIMERWAGFLTGQQADVINLPRREGQGTVLRCAN